MRGDIHPFPQYVFIWCLTKSSWRTCLNTSIREKKKRQFQTKLLKLLDLFPGMNSFLMLYRCGREMGCYITTIINSNNVFTKL
jgi:hypothetical protein